MKKNIIVFSLCIVTITASSQVEDQTLKVLPQQKKNEVYVNIVPILKVLVGGYSENNRFSVTYKRGINEKSALRFSAMFNVINGYYIGSNNIVNLWASDGDTIKYINEARSSRYIKPQVNIGYERIFGKHKLKWFYGSDLLFGYSEKQSQYQYYNYYKDLSIPSAGYIQSENFNVSSKLKTYSIGISPFFGAKYPISKRFLVSTQLTFDFAWQRQIVSEVDGSNSKTITISSSETKINLPFFNDVSIIYSF